MKIDCQVNPESQTKTFVIQGDLDVNNVKSLKAQVLDALESGQWTYLIDMANIDYLDSSGLGMLVFLKKEILRRDSKMVVINLTHSVLSILQLTKLDEFFEVNATDDS